MPAKVFLPDRICLKCGTSFNRSCLPSGRLEGIFDFKLRKFCSPDCYVKWRIGENHYRYKKEGSIRKDGYVRITIPGTNKRPYLHRYIMEQKLGRKLYKNEHVHHKDGNPTNNNIDNLELLNQSTHLKHHYKFRKINNKGRFTA